MDELMNFDLPPERSSNSLSQSLRGCAMEALGGSQVAMTRLISAASALDVPARVQTNPTANTRQTTPANENSFCLFLMFPPPLLGCG